MWWRGRGSGVECVAAPLDGRGGAEGGAGEAENFEDEGISGRGWGCGLRFPLLERRDSTRIGGDVGGVHSQRER